MSIARLMQMARAGVPSGPVWTDPDLANASYDSVSFSVAGQETSPLGLFFKDDGSKMYVIGNASDNVHEYDLSTAWDVSTSSFNQSFSVSAQTGNPSSVFFRSDGIKMYVNSNAGNKVLEYDLATAWDVSTASYNQQFYAQTQDTSMFAVSFKPDGTKMYMSGNTQDSIHEYNLGTAWDISTSSFVQSFSVASQETSPRNTFFSPTGDKVFLVGNNFDNVNEYSLTTPWDISTASFVQAFSVATQESGPCGLFFKSDGSKMYIVGFINDTIYQYST